MAGAKESGVLEQFRESNKIELTIIQLYNMHMFMCIDNI